MSMTRSNRSSNFQSTSAVTVEDTQSLAKFYEKNDDYRDAESDYEGRESLNRKIHFHVGDIADFCVDAIVCSIQTVLTCKPYGMHKKVTSRAGRVYKETCSEVGYCKAGDAFITDGYDLDAKYIIHTAGVSPDTTLNYEERQGCLKKSYLSCLEIVKQSPEIRTLAVPCLGSGGGGLELADAISTAVTTIRQWLESENNLTQVDSIVLVMYDENQWNDYSKELFKTFPHGKDLAGIDMETLDTVDVTTMLGFVPRTAISTNILCYQYKKSAVRQVAKHLHSIVNRLQRNLGTRTEPVERYRNCGTFLIHKVHKHRVVIYHGEKSCTLEVQIISYSDNPDNFQSVLDLCEELQSLIDNYLITNLENVTTYKTCIRCENSSWGDADGIISMKKIKRKISGTATMQCRHRKSATNMTHSVNLNEISKFWINQDQGDPHREPGEHTESEDSISWPSLASISSSESGGTSEQKLDHVTTETRASARTPVEHSDDSPNTFSKVKNFVKSKFQVFSKSNKNTTDTTSDRDQTSLSSNYQPLNDSLLQSESQQLTQGREPEENTIYSRHHKTDPAQAWESTSGEQLKYEGHQQTLQGSKQNGSLSRECGCNSPTSTGHGQNTGTGRRINSHSSSGSGQNRTSREDTSSLSNNCDCGMGQCKHEGCSRLLSCGMNVDSLGACGGSSYGLKSGPDSNNSSEITTLNDKTLLNIARMIGNRETQLGLELGLAYACIQRIKSENSGDAIMEAFCILREWKIQQRGKGSIETLLDAMTNCSIDTSSLTTFS